MSLILTDSSALIGGRNRGMTRVSSLFCHAAFMWIICAASAWATPVILNQPMTAIPGDIVSVTGNGFGSSPKVYFRPESVSAQVQVKIIKGDNNFVAFQVPKTQPFDLYYIMISDGTKWSNKVGVNYPQVMQFDKPELAGNDSFRIFGRNLYVGPVPPTVKLNDLSTGAWLDAAVDLSKSDAYSLTVTAPAGIIASHKYRVRVTRGVTYSNSVTCLLGHANSGEDHFKLGVPWGRDYIYKNGPAYNGTADNADHHVYDVTNDRFLALHAKGDGIADDQPAIQAAINQASWHGGGIVYLPAGTYRLASPSGSGVRMYSNVVLQGHSASDTTILLGPATQQPSSYIFWGFNWETNAKMSGLADLSIKNIDTRSQSANTFLTGGPSSKLFVQRVNFDLGTGLFLSVRNADRFVFANSTIRHAINRQWPQAPSPDNSGIGPVWFDQLSNFTFQNNNLWWASGGNAFHTINGGVIEGNHFTRSASDKITVTASNFAWLNGDAPETTIRIGDSVQRHMGRQISVEFGYNVVIQNNIFDVSDGVLRYNTNDGETINSEGGNSASQTDVGTVTSASTTSVTDNSKCAGTCNWNYISSSAFNAGSKIAIVSGQGAGQWRPITTRKNNTFTVSPAWNIVPDPGDRFAILVPSLENTLIRTNVMKDNPAGITLWGSAFYNLSVVKNTLTDNGGIHLFGVQDALGKTTPIPKIDTSRNIEVIGNILTNTKSLFPAYINIGTALDSPNYLWGRSLDGIEVRDNSVTARAGTPSHFFPDGGYMNSLNYTQGGVYSPNGVATSILGTIFQGNNCTNCPVFYKVSTGVTDTILWNSKVNGAGVTTPAIYNKVFSGTPGAVGTIVGND